MLFSHALIILVNQSDDVTGGNDTSRYVTVLRCVNPREHIALFRVGTFAGVWVSALYLLYFVIGLTAVVGNILVITAVFKFPWLQVSTNLLVASLAASDLLIGMCIVADCILYHFNMCAFHYEECVVTTCVQVVSVVASHVNLLQASYDRHVYIASPLHYNTTSRKQRLRITIPLVWIYSVLVGVTPIIPTLTSGRSRYKTCTVYKVYPPVFLALLFTINCYILYIVVMVFYFRIWKIATRHKRKLSKVTGRGTVSTGLKVNWKSTKLLAMITVSLFALSIPYTIVVLYLMSCPKCSIVFPLLLFIYVCFYATTCVNFVIYVWYSKDFKRAFKLIVVGIFHKKTDHTHRTSYNETHTKQTFKTDKRLDAISPRPRRKFGVAGLEFNRHLPKEALSYIRGDRTPSSRSSHVYDNPAVENQDGNEFAPKPDDITQDCQNGQLQADERVHSANETVIVSSSSDSDCDRSDGEEIYTILNATSHMTRQRHLASNVHIASLPTHGKTKTSKSGINSLVLLKNTRSLPIGVYPQKYTVEVHRDTSAAVSTHSEIPTDHLTETDESNISHEENDVMKEGASGDAANDRPVMRRREKLHSTDLSTKTTALAEDLATPVSKPLEQQQLRRDKNGSDLSPAIPKMKQFLHKRESPVFRKISLTAGECDEPCQEEQTGSSVDAGVSCYSNTSEGNISISEGTCCFSNTREDVSPSEGVCCYSNTREDVSLSEGACCYSNTAEDVSLSERACCYSNTGEDVSLSEGACCYSNTREDVSLSEDACCYSNTAEDVSPSEGARCYSNSGGEDMSPSEGARSYSNSGGEDMSPSKGACCYSNMRAADVSPTEEKKCLSMHKYKQLHTDAVGETHLQTSRENDPDVCPLHEGPNNSSQKDIILLNSDYEPSETVQGKCSHREKIANDDRILVENVENCSRLDRMKQKSFPKKSESKREFHPGDNRRNSMPEVLGTEKSPNDFKLISKTDSGFEDFDHIVPDLPDDSVSQRPIMAKRATGTDRTTGTAVFYGPNPRHTRCKTSFYELQSVSMPM